jgi:enoyl-CoA hydratase/carnithine racemase
MSEVERGAAGVGVSQDGPVAVVELTRPPHNLLDAALMSEVVDAVEALGNDTACRAIVIAAQGRSFSAGGNFSAEAGSFAAGGSLSDAFRAAAQGFYQQVERFFAAPKPLVAAIHGPAIGAGLGLALACDLRVINADAFCAVNFVRLGIHPGFAISLTLPWMIGPGRAADMLLTGRRVGGDEAYRLGLVDRVAAAPEVREVALALAGEIAEAAPLAVAATRATLRRGLAADVRETLSREIEEQAALAATADAAEGIAAMLQRRQPKFEGR